MGLKEGSIVPVNLRCGCRQVSVTLLKGVQRVKCTECGKSTEIIIRVDSKSDVSDLTTRWA
ncbi:hypothetical protein K8I28_14315 [bacterium]|nr:hypothetical protein [bacterium]